MPDPPESLTVEEVRAALFTFWAINGRRMDGNKRMLAQGEASFLNPSVSDAVFAELSDMEQSRISWDRWRQHRTRLKKSGHPLRFTPFLED